MDSSLIWAKLHGATTHFPFALVLCSGACDAVGFALTARPTDRDPNATQNPKLKTQNCGGGLTAAGYWTMLLGALGSIPAVFSGLVMTKGGVLGHGALRWHHLFVWPAFGLMIALAVWRVCIGDRATRGMFAGYLAVVAMTTVLISAAGYWGGELMLAR